MTTEVPPCRAQRADFTWFEKERKKQLLGKQLQPRAMFCLHLKANTDLGFHASNANPRLASICDGLLISRVEYINELGII